MNIPRPRAPSSPGACLTFAVVVIIVYVTALGVTLLLVAENWTS